MSLQIDGFDAYTMQIEVGQESWHRVYLGRYVDEVKAKDDASGLVDIEVQGVEM